MGRIDTAVQLFKASWALIRQDSELLVLPLLSGIASLATMGLFALPLLATVDIDALLDPFVDGGASWPTYGLIVALYIVLAFITVFFNAALVHGANERMNGGDPTLSSALDGAASRIRRILPWAIVSATVSWMIHRLQERLGFLGAIVGLAAGLAWAAVTFLVLPILVIENVGVVDAVKRSAALLRSVWGEGLAGHVGMGLISFAAALPFIGVGILGLVAGIASESVALAVAAIAVAGIGLLAVAVVMSALSIVYQTALYRFAIGRPVVAYDPQLLQHAFRRRVGR